MKHLQSLLVVSFVLFLAVTSQAKAAYKGKTQMIETAEIIAIVEITGSEKAEVKGKYWTYRQKASAKAEKVLKGKLPNTVSLFGDEDFICARCHFEAGRYLVFLDRDGELLTGNNWHLSIRKISGESQERVEWFDDDKIFEKKDELLDDVVKEIARVLGKPKQAAAKQN